MFFPICENVSRFFETRDRLKQDGREYSLEIKKKEEKSSKFEESWKDRILKVFQLLLFKKFLPILTIGNDHHRPIHFSSCSNGIDQSLLHRIPIERRELFATRAKIVHVENRGYFPRYNWFDTVQFLKGHWQMVQVNDPVYWLVRWTASIFQLPKKNYRLSINIYRTLHR